MQVSEEVDILYGTRPCVSFPIPMGSRNVAETIIDYTPFLLARCNRDPRYISVSRSYAALLGLTPHDIIGKRVADVVGAAGFETMRPHIQAALAGKQVEYEAEIKIADVGPRHYHVTLVPERDGQSQVVGYIASIIDITERKVSQEILAAQLEAMQSLQAISTQLLGEENAEALYQKVMDAATLIMHSDFASLQVFDPQQGPHGQLHLLAYRGFNKEAERFWKWVTPESKSTCGQALRTGQRVIVADIEESAALAGSADLETYLQTGIRSVQTTPLVSRTGHLVGMISTHWRYPHNPRQQDLLLLDVLARQAADLIERSLTEEHTRLLVREVGHRAKNLLAVVEGIVQQTVSEGGAQIWAQALSARLAALAANQALLVQSDWRGVEIGELIRSQLEHLSALIGRRIMLHGPPVPITPSAAQTLSMAFHELATNAVKYGALSNSTGIVSIRWALTDDSNPRLFLNWQESNGPPVVRPLRQGFGTDVMVQMVEHALDAEVSLDYDSRGVNWRVSAPKATVIDVTRSGFTRSQIGEVV